MSATTLVASTTTEREGDPVSEPPGAGIRVTLREVREYTYRALVVAGASAGEAADGAAQVSYAELHDGTGVAGLVADLRRGAWPRAGLSFRRGAASVLEVDCGARLGELRVAPALVDLAAGEPGPAVVATATEVPLTALLDRLLLTAAETTGTTLTALRRGSHGALGVRHATAGGDLAHGRIAPTAVVGPFGLDHVVEWAGLVVVTGATVDTGSAGLIRCGAGQREQRRRAAARRGLDVDEAAWRQIAQQAHHFLVPEDD